jgi:hypothetical protein
MAKPKFYECGICNSYHPVLWDGDCRDDENRFNHDDLNDKYGFIGWVEIPEASVDFYQQQTLTKEEL